MPTFLFRTLVLNMQESSTPALGGSNRAWEVLGQSLAMYGVRSIRNSYGVYWLSRCLVPPKVPNTKHDVCDITRTVQRGGHCDGQGFTGILRVRLSVTPPTSSNPSSGRSRGGTGVCEVPRPRPLSPPSCPEGCSHQGEIPARPPLHGATTGGGDYSCVSLIRGRLPPPPVLRSHPILPMLSRSGDNNPLWPSLTPHGRSYGKSILLRSPQRHHGAVGSRRKKKIPLCCL